MNVQSAKVLRKAPLNTPTDLSSEAVRDISGALNALLADVFALLPRPHTHTPYKYREIALNSFTSAGGRAPLPFAAASRQ